MGIDSMGEKIPWWQSSNWEYASKVWLSVLVRFRYRTEDESRFRRLGQEEGVEDKRIMELIPLMSTCVSRLSVGETTKFIPQISACASRHSKSK
jgi:hypothetical protein